MKKFLAIILATVLSLSLVACNSNSNETDINSNSDTEVSEEITNKPETVLQELPEEISEIKFDDKGRVSFTYKELYPMGAQMLENYRNGVISRETAEKDAEGLGFESVVAFLTYMQNVVDYLNAYSENYK